MRCLQEECGGSRSRLTPPGLGRTLRRNLLPISPFDDLDPCLMSTCRKLPAFKRSPAWALQQVAACSGIPPRHNRSSREAVSCCHHQGCLPLSPQVGTARASVGTREPKGGGPDVGMLSSCLWESTADSQEVWERDRETVQPAPQGLVLRVGPLARSCGKVALPVLFAEPHPCPPTSMPWR